jgi:hypothetical protein
MNGRRTPTAAERMEHIQTLELLAALIIALPRLPAVRKQFVLFQL